MAHQNPARIVFKPRATATKIANLGDHRQRKSGEGVRPRSAALRRRRGIADIAPFLTGIYPDHAALFVQRPGSQAPREPGPPWTAALFEALAEKFKLEGAAFNTLSDRYLEPLRDRYLDLRPGDAFLEVKRR